MEGCTSGAVPPAPREEHRIANRFTTLRLSMFVTEGHFPRLRGKAAEIRHFAFPLLMVFRKHMQAGDRIHRLVAQGLRHSARMEALLDANQEAVAWSAEVSADFLASARAFLACQTALASHFHARAELLFSTTIKSHYLLHAAVLSRQCNPRLAWNYAGEDLMHRVRILVGAAQHGAPPRLVVSKVLRRYIRGLSYDLASDLGWWR